MSVSAVRLKHIVLLNIDMQHFFVEGAPDGFQVMQRVNRLIASCRKANILVIHTSHVFKPQVPNVEEAIALHKDLNVIPDDIIFDKYHFGAFYNSNLEEILRSRGLDTIIIAGIRTNVCCEVTTWEAISRGFSVFFLSDGTATKEMGGVSPAILQTATCATLNHLFGNVITVNEMIAAIEQASGMPA
ncbi:MAG: cysteine hydrolase [Anaerolineae bacterium]|nr:cysteine hydrolase [Anaerolineae bacterium]